MRFSGVSFGGIFQRVHVHGKDYKATFGKVWRKKEYDFSVKKMKIDDKIFSRFYFFFPLIDVAAFLFYLFFNFLGGIIDSSGIKVPTVSPVAIQVGVIVFIIFEYLFLYLILIRGVRKWHGTEHKVISALENNDIDNAKSYSAIHERCGGTLIPTIIFAYILWYFFALYTGIVFGNFTFITLFIVVNVKVFHKYDKFGIWFGKLFQKYFSVKEPDDWQLDIGKVAVRNLLLAEQGKDYEEKRTLHRGIK